MRTSEKVGREVVSHSQACADEPTGFKLLVRVDASTYGVSLSLFFVFGPHRRREREEDCA